MQILTFGSGSSRHTVDEVRVTDEEYVLLVEPVSNFRFSEVELEESVARSVWNNHLDLGQHKKNYNDILMRDYIILISF